MSEQDSNIESIRKGLEGKSQEERTLELIYCLQSMLETALRREEAIIAAKRFLKENP